MKKLILFPILFFALVGCAQIKEAKDSASLCLQDPACRAEAVSQSENAKGIAKDISGVSPIPLSSNVVGGVAYGLVFLYALIKGGKKKKNEGETNG